MKTLLIVAHGSRNPDSVIEIESLATASRALLSQYSIVEHAFLELAKPDIVCALKSLIDQGATEIVILPYFLARGNHVMFDIPEEVNKLIKTHSTVKITTLPHLGANHRMAAFVTEHVSESLSQLEV